MARQPAKTTQPASPPEDPLADLRQPDAPALPETPVQGNQEDLEPEPPEVTDLRPMVTQEVWDEMVAEVVAAWHADPTSQGFLHGGGAVCGCRYMARVALQAAVPVVTEEDLEPKELEPSSD